MFTTYMLPYHKALELLPPTHQSINLMITISIRPLVPSRRWLHSAECLFLPVWLAVIDRLETQWGHTRPCELLALNSLVAYSSSVSLSPKTSLSTFFFFLIGFSMPTWLSLCLSLSPSRSRSRSLSLSPLHPLPLRQVCLPPARSGRHY